MPNTPRLGLPYPAPTAPADVPADLQALATALDALVYIVGEMRTFGMLNPPAKWLRCDGSVVLQADYPELYAAIQTTWNTGGEIASGVGANFRMPGTSGRALVGAGAGSGLTNRAVGARFGVEAVPLAAGHNGPHGHGVNDPGHIHGLVSQRSSAGPGAGFIEGGTSGSPLARRFDGGYWEDIAVQTAGTGVSIQSQGSGTPHENMPPSLGVLIAIYAGR